MNRATKSRENLNKLIINCKLINISIFYRDINVLLSRTSSIDDVFSLFTRDFDLDASKIIQILVTLLKERSIRNESVENKRRENIKNSIENNEISESDKNEKSHRNERDLKNSKSVKNRN
jgi:hypothetical protein